jgi:ElaB/YqjD/DUF883 family membrane-anchored ribosome-binding protein
LEDLFLTVSTLATQVVTRPNLEKQINEWKLVNTNETDMFRSITRLFNLLDKIRADFGQTEANTVELFRQAVALISRQEGLPRYIQEALELARLRVKDSDSTGEMTQVLVSACQRYVGQRPAKNQVKAIEYIPDGHASNYAAAVHQMQYPALMPPPPPVTLPQLPPAPVASLLAAAAPLGWRPGVLECDACTSSSSRERARRLQQRRQGEQ